MSRPIITDPTGTPGLGLPADPLEALRDCLAFSSRDWSQEPDLAWLYGIVLGWDDPDEEGADATEDVAARFGWDAAKVARLRALRAAFKAAYLEHRGDPGDAAPGAWDTDLGFGHIHDWILDRSDYEPCVCGAVMPEAPF